MSVLDYSQPPRTPLSRRIALAACAAAATVTVIGTVTPATAAPVKAPSITATVPNYIQKQCSRFTGHCRWVQTNPPYNSRVGTVPLPGIQWVWVWF